MASSLTMAPPAVRPDPRDPADPADRAAPVLYGRGGELDALTRLLDRARSGGGGALTVAAGPGLGRTALLEAAAVRASSCPAPGFAVLHTRGVPSERGVPQAGLHRLLHPVLHLAGDLPAVHAARLTPITGTRAAGDGTADAFGLFAAVCALLVEATRDGPLLCLVDDADELDRVSLEALAFAARRVEDVPAVLVFAVGAGANECLADIPSVTPGPLDEADAARALGELAPGLDEEAADAVVALAGGNPLALVELAGSLTHEQRSGSAPPPTELPAGSRLRRHHRRLVARLADGPRRLALLVAIEDGLLLETLERAAADDGIDPGDLDAARACGLVEVDGDRVRAPDAPARSSVYADASPADRRWAHALLARVMSGPRDAARRAWHRAASAGEPDDALADGLADAARSLRSAGEHEESARCWRRAATLTASADTGADRYIEAARDAWAAGRTRQARAMLRQVRPRTDADGPVGRADLLQGEIELFDGLPVMALWILREAADRLATTDPALAMTALLHASAAADVTGDHHCQGAITARALEVARRAGASGSTAPLVELARCYFAGMSAAVRGRDGKAAALLGRVLEIADELDGSRTGGEALSWACVAAIVLGDDRRARDVAARATVGARAGMAVGLPASLPKALALLAHSEVFLGRYPAAEATAREGLRLARSAGQRNYAIELRAVLALLAAFRGDREAALEMLDGLAEEGGRRELVRATALDGWAMACLDLADDRPADAAAALRHPVAGGSRYPVIRLMAVPHLVEASVRIDRREPALRAFGTFERWAARGPGQPTRSAMAERCRALLAADDEGADAHFDLALRLHEEGDSPFELARTALLYGHRLRRGRRPRDARPHLRNAAQIFQRAGAERWAARARAELRAAGETLEEPGAGEDTASVAGPLDALTAQQSQIARLVAGGATNREIAARLVISPRTVDGHLRNIFTRLGLRSRTELARLLR